MSAWLVRFVAVLFWGATALALFTRGAWAPAAWLADFRPRTLDRGAWIAFGLTLYGIVRLVLTRRAARGSGPTFRERVRARRRSPSSGVAGTQEYHPELDFTRPVDPPPDRL